MNSKLLYLIYIEYFFSRIRKHIFFLFFFLNSIIELDSFISSFDCSRIACDTIYKGSWLSPFLSTKNVRNNDTLCFRTECFISWYLRLYFFFVFFSFFFFCFFDVASWTYCYFIWNSKVVSNSGAYLGIVHVLSCAAQYKRRGPAHSLLSLVYTHFFLTSSYSFSLLSHYFLICFSFLSLSLFFSHIRTHTSTHVSPSPARASMCVCVFVCVRVLFLSISIHSCTHVTHITYHIWYI